MVSIVSMGVSCLSAWTPVVPCDNFLLGRNTWFFCRPFDDCKTFGFLPVFAGILPAPENPVVVVVEEGLMCQVS